MKTFGWIEWQKVIADRALLLVRLMRAALDHIHHKARAARRGWHARRLRYCLACRPPSRLTGALARLPPLSAPPVQSGLRGLLSLVALQSLINLQLLDSWVNFRKLRNLPHFCASAPPLLARPSVSLPPRASAHGPLALQHVPLAPAPAPFPAPQRSWCSASGSRTRGARRR